MVDHKIGSEDHKQAQWETKATRRGSRNPRPAPRTPHPGGCGVKNIKSAIRVVDRVVNHDDLSSIADIEL